MTGPTKLRNTQFRIARWLVDPSNNELRHGGTHIKLEPKVMDVLIYLAERPEQVVSREELEDNVWAGRVVSYDAITAAIVKLRKALGKGKQQGPLIKTVSKRGYCLPMRLRPHAHP